MISANVDFTRINYDLFYSSNFSVSAS